MPRDIIEDKPAWMSLRAASKQFGLKKGTIQHWAASGQVVAAKEYCPEQGRMIWVVSRKDMERVVTERTTQKEVEW